MYVGVSRRLHKLHSPKLSSDAVMSSLIRDSREEIRTRIRVRADRICEVRPLLHAGAHPLP
jgi:hypothetical protein